MRNPRGDQRAGPICPRAATSTPALRDLDVPLLYSSRAFICTYYCDMTPTASHFQHEPLKPRDPDRARSPLDFFFRNLVAGLQAGLQEHQTVSSLHTLDKNKNKVLGLAHAHTSPRQGRNISFCPSTYHTNPCQRLQSGHCVVVVVVLLLLLLLLLPILVDLVTELGPLLASPLAWKGRRLRDDVLHFTLVPLDHIGTVCANEGGWARQEVGAGAKGRDRQGRDTRYQGRSKRRVSAGGMSP